MTALTPDPVYFEVVLKYLKKLSITGVAGACKYCNDADL